MTPQALSRHLRVLRKAGLVAEAGIEDDARVRVYSVHPAAFQPVQQWLAQLEEVWRRHWLSKSSPRSLFKDRKPPPCR